MAVCAKVFVTVERYTILLVFADVFSCYFVIFHSVRFHIPDIMCLHAFVVAANYVLTGIVLFCLYILQIFELYQLAPGRVSTYPVSGQVDYSDHVVRRSYDWRAPKNCRTPNSE